MRQCLKAAVSHRLDESAFSAAHSFCLVVDQKTSRVVQWLHKDSLARSVFALAMHINHSPATSLTTCKQQMPRVEKALLAMAALQDAQELSEEPKDSTCELTRAYNDAYSKCHEVLFRPFLAAVSGQLAKAASQIPDSYPDIVQAGLEDSLSSTFTRKKSVVLAGQIDELLATVVSSSSRRCSSALPHQLMRISPRRGPQHKSI